jgi:hypothetical protein
MIAMSAPKYVLYMVFTLAGLCGLYWIVFIYQLDAPVLAEYWIYDSRIVKEHIARSIQGQKLIITSGSNSFFGIDSALIEKETGIPTVNLATHAGLSVDYLLNDAKKYLQRNDIIILPLELYYYWVPSPYTTWFTSQIMAWDSGYFRTLNVLEQFRFVSSTPPQRILAGLLASVTSQSVGEKRKRILKRPDQILNMIRLAWTEDGYAPKEIYSYLNINRHGDAVKSKESSYVEDTDYGLNRQFVPSTSTWETLKTFHSYCRSHGIGLYIAWPATMKNKALDFNSDAVQASLTEIRTRINELEIPILGDLREFTYERAFFTDTFDHLNKAGRIQRTQQLIHYLKASGISHSYPLHGLYRESK